MTAQHRHLLSAGPAVKQKFVEIIVHENLALNQSIAEKFCPSMMSLVDESPPGASGLRQILGDRCSEVDQ